MKIKINNQDGFTITELIIVMIVSTLLSGLTLTFLFNYWQYAFTLDYSQESLIERLNTSDYLRDSFSTSAGLIIQNSLPDSNANVPDPDTSSIYWIPIHAIPSTLYPTSDNIDVPLIYYRRFSFNASGNYIYNGTQPFEDEYVLYLNSANNRVMLRSIANPYAPNNRMLSSCPPATANATCPEDKILINNVSSVALRYFSRTGNVIDWTSTWDALNNTYAGPDFPSVEVLELTVNVDRGAKFSSSANTKNSTIIRISLRNY